MRINKYVPAYKDVVHVTEQARRKKYNGCVSRQVLRHTLFKEAVDGIRAQYSKEDHRLIRQIARDKSKREFRLIRGI